MNEAVLCARESYGGLVRVDLRVDAEVRATHVRHGQFVELHDLGGEAPSRGYFALASDPGASSWSLLVKRTGSMAERLLTLPPQSVLGISGALGRGFPYADLGARPLLLAVTGSGISAVLSAARARIRDGLGRQTFLAYGVRGTQGVALGALLRDIRQAGLSITICSTDSALGPIANGLGYVEGRVQQVVPKLDWRLAGGAVFVAGHAEFFEDMHRLAPTLSIDPDQIYTNA